MASGSVDVAIERVAELRAAGELNSSDVLAGLVWRLRDRADLDRLIGEFDTSGLVGDRVEETLRLRAPVEASDDEIEEWGYAAIQEWLGLAARRLDEGPVLDAFRALGDMAVEVVDVADREAGFPLNGTYLGTPGDDGSELSGAQLALLHNASAELLDAEMVGVGWDGVSALLFGALGDEPMLGGWLLSPAGSWEFDFEPFFRLWRAGASLWLSGEMVEAVRGSAVWPEGCDFGRPRPEPLAASPADQAWLADAGPAGPEAVRFISSLGGGNIDLSGFGLLSLPPAIVVDGGWRVLQLGKNPGLDPSRLSELDRVESLTLSSCGLTSFDIALPLGLLRLSLAKNELASWPAGVAAAGAELLRLALNDNHLSEVPDAIGALGSLNDLPLAGNKIASVSPAIGQLSQLKKLDLARNAELTSLPVEILDLPDNCRLYLGRTALPESFQKASTIADLRQVWTDLAP